MADSRNSIIEENNSQALVFAGEEERERDAANAGEPAEAKSDVSREEMDDYLARVERYASNSESATKIGIMAMLIKRPIENNFGHLPGAGELVRKFNDLYNDAKELEKVYTQNKDNTTRINNNALITDEFRTKAKNVFRSFTEFVEKNEALPGWRHIMDITMKTPDYISRAYDPIDRKSRFSAVETIDDSFTKICDNMDNRYFTTVPVDPEIHKNGGSKAEQEILSFVALLWDTAQKSRSPQAVKNGINVDKPPVPTKADIASFNTPEGRSQYMDRVRSWTKRIMRKDQVDFKVFDGKCKENILNTVNSYNNVTDYMNRLSDMIDSDNRTPEEKRSDLKELSLAYPDVSPSDPAGLQDSKEAMKQWLQDFGANLGAAPKYRDPSEFGFIENKLTEIKSAEYRRLFMNDVIRHGWTKPEHEKFFNSVLDLNEKLKVHKMHVSLEILNVLREIEYSEDDISKVYDAQQDLSLYVLALERSYKKYAALPGHDEELLKSIDDLKAEGQALADSEYSRINEIKNRAPKEPGVNPYAGKEDEIDFGNVGEDAAANKGSADPEPAVDEEAADEENPEEENGADEENAENENANEANEENPRPEPEVDENAEINTPMPQEFEKAMNGLEDDEDYKARTFFEDFYRRGMNRPGDPERLRAMYNYATKLNTPILKKQISEIPKKAGSRQEAINQFLSEVRMHPEKTPSNVFLLNSIQDIIDEANESLEPGKPKFHLSYYGVKRLNKFREEHGLPRVIHPEDEEANVRPGAGADEPAGREEKAPEGNNGGAGAAGNEDAVNEEDPLAAGDDNTIIDADPGKAAYWTDAMKDSGKDEIYEVSRKMFFVDMKKLDSSRDNADLAKAIWTIESDPANDSMSFIGGKYNTVNEVMGSVLSDLLAFDNKLLVSAIINHPEAARTIFEKWNELNPEDQIDVGILTEISVTQREGEDPETYEDRMYNELITLKEKGDLHEIVSRLNAMQTFILENGTDLYNSDDKGLVLDPVFTANRNVIDRFFDSLMEKTNSTGAVDQNEMKFVSDLADEMGTVSAGLHIQNGMDISDMEKTIEEGGVENTDVVRGKKTETRNLASALVNYNYHNAKRLQSMNVLLDKMKDAMPDMRLKFGNSKKNRSIKAYINTSFNQSSETAKIMMKFKGLPKKYTETVDELYEKGAFRQPDVLLQDVGYKFNGHAKQKEAGLFEVIPDEQEFINQTSVNDLEKLKDGMEDHQTIMAEYKTRIKLIADEAKARLDALDDIKKEGHRDSTEYTNMRNALVAVSKLNEEKSVTEVYKAVRDLDTTSAEYIRTRDVWYRSFRNFGERRLSASKDIADYNNRWLNSIINIEGKILMTGGAFDREARVDKQIAKVDGSITSYEKGIARKKEVDLKDLNKSNKGIEKIDAHKRRLDLRSADKRAKEAGDPGMEGPQK